MLQSNTSFTLLSKINITDTTSDTFTISNENENDTPIDTGGEQVSIVFSNKRQRERFIVTIVNNVCTIVNRGLSQKGGVASTALQKQWLEGTGGYITALDFDIFEKDSETEQEITADLKLSGELDAGVMNSSNGFDYRVDGSNFRIRKDGSDMKLTDDNQSEISLSTIAAASGSDEKIKISVNDTTAGYLNGKLIVGAGLDLTEVNNGANETLRADLDITDTGKFSTSGVASRAVVTDGSGNLFQATTSKRGGVELATDTEALSGTDTSRYTNSKQLLDFTKYKTIQASHDSSSTTTKIIPHGLGRTPRFMRIIGEKSNTFSFGTYDGVDNRCITTVRNVSNDNINCIYLGDNESQYIGGVASWDSTNITLTWSKVSSPFGTGYIQIEII